MSASERTAWTPDDFLAWSGHQDARHEFDGTAPVAMTGGTIAHAIITRNISLALAPRLAGGPCQVLGPDAGMQTAGQAIRYPDALVTCATLNPRATLVPAVVAVFEVISPTSASTDRIIKVREYAATPSVLRYVIVESASVGLTVFDRKTGAAAWSATTLSAADILLMLELNIEVPVMEFYAGLEFTSPL